MGSVHDQRQAFIDKRNAEIGRDIDRVLADHNHYPGFKPEVEIIDKETKEYLIGDPKYCYFSVRVDMNTNKIISWSYLGEAVKCKYQKHSCDPW